MSSRDSILNKLRAARRPFPDAPPRPTRYLHVTVQDDETPDKLLERFTQELTDLKGEVFAVKGDAKARARILDLLRQQQARSILAWDFAHIPVEGLESAIREAGIEIVHPETHDEMRMEMLTASEQAQVGVTGVEAAVATTGTLVVRTGPGKGRLPTVLAPAYIAVIRLEQLVPRLENWFEQQRLDGLSFKDNANFCFITGPSRTGDIEMELILGVHGPGIIKAVVIR